jgi:WD40-like Beta Propeller Repeat
MKIPRAFGLGLFVIVLMGVTFDAESRRPDCEESAWSEPVNLGPVINSPFLEQHPALTTDGLSLYFISNRPGPQGTGAADIWVSERRCATCDWEAPQNLTVINTPAAEGGVSLSPDGHLLFFHSDRRNPQPGGRGNDIYVSYRVNTNDNFAWQPPTRLGPEVNTDDQGEFAPEFVTSGAPYVEEDEKGHAARPALYFGRGPDGNNQDIWVAPVTRDGETIPGMEAQIVDDLNSPQGDAAPTVRTDRREVLFWSLRQGAPADIWVATRQNTNVEWSEPVNLGPPISTPFNEITPNLSHNGKTLLFSSNRPDSIPSPAPSTALSMDIWMSTRVPGCR